MSHAAVGVKDSSSHYRPSSSSSSSPSTSTSTNRGGAGGISALQQLSELATASSNGNGTNHAGGHIHADQRSTATHGHAQVQASPPTTIDTTSTPLDRTTAAQPATRNHTAAMTQIGSPAQLIASASTPAAADGAAARSHVLTQQAPPAPAATTLGIAPDLNAFTSTPLVPSHDVTPTPAPAPAPVASGSRSVSPNSTSAQQQQQQQHHHRPCLSHATSKPILIPPPYSNSLPSRPSPPRPIVPSPRSHLPIDRPPPEPSPPPAGSSPGSVSVAASQDDIDLLDPNEPHSKASPLGVGLKTSKRAVQNRAAQRAFRERREKHMKDLEMKAGLVDEYQAREQKHLQRIDQLECELFCKPRPPPSSSSSPCSRCHPTPPDRDLPKARPLPPPQYLAESPPLSSSSNDPSLPSLHHALRQSRQHAHDLEVQVEALKSALDESQRSCADLRRTFWELGDREVEGKEGCSGVLGGERSFTGKGSGVDVDLSMDVNMNGDMKRCRSMEGGDCKNRGWEARQGHVQVRMQTFPIPPSKKARVWE